MRLERQDGLAVPVPQAVARFFAALAMLVAAVGAGRMIHPGLYLTILVPFAWTLIDADRRTLYDIVSGTRLVFAKRDDA